MELACLDGNVTPAAEAVIPVTDEGFLRGDGVFEVVRVYDGRIFALEEARGLGGDRAVSFFSAADSIEERLRSDAVEIEVLAAEHS